jgi:DNA-binding IclR family transcriptional regulator
MSGSREGTSRTIKSVEKTLAVLEALKETGGAGVTALSERVDMSPGSIHHYLASLEKHGYVTKRDGAYYVGARFLSLGGHARQQLAIYNESREKIDELATETGETARLVGNCQGHFLTLYQHSDRPGRATNTYEGFEEAPHSTAAGKAILAALPTETAEEIVAYHGLPSRTENTITDPAELDAELERVRSRGFAVDDEECFEGVLCLADSITTSNGAVHGAISVSAPVERIDRESFVDSTAPLLSNATGVVGISQTYSGWDE